MAMINNFKTVSRPKKKSNVVFTTPIGVQDYGNYEKYVDEAAREAILNNYLDDCFVTRLAIKLAKLYYALKA